MRLKILASVLALSPVLLLAAASVSAFEICDGAGKCVSGTPEADNAAAVAAPAPLQPVVVAPPPAPVLIAPPAPAPVVEATPVMVTAPAPAPVPAYASQSVSVPTESGDEVVVITQASGPASSQSAAALPASALPPKGMSRAAVSSQFGQPHTRHAPVGGGSPRQPPITRWDYAGFSVFFEHDHVVDAVERNNPAPIAVRDGLAGGPKP